MHLPSLLLLEGCLSPEIEEPKQTYSPTQGHENRSVTLSNHDGFTGETNDSRNGLRAGMEG